ncbi:MAG TPA: TetR family transcriptional regulator [Gemmatimonadaceae bacterium]|nr:TetR family transcriptional regulator [Gemmatimonadaceae bacterium]
MTATDTASTRETILDAAEELFARRGFSATTIKQIAAGAGVNSALLYYYFDDKEALYRAVLGRLVEGLTARAASRMADDGDPASAVRGFVEGQTEYLLAHPRMPRIVVRELLEHDAKHAEAVIAQTAAKGFERLCGVIERGQKRGVFRRNIDARFAAISTIAQVVYVFIARPAVGILLGHGPAGLPSDEIRRFGRHAAAFAIAALTPQAASS